MSQELNLALAQLTPKLRDIEANVQTINRVLEEHPAADLIIFPELFLGGYTTIDLEHAAVTLDGQDIGSVAKTAKKNETAVIFGFTERLTSGYSNSAMYISDVGELAGVYRKTHLFDAERKVFVPGDELLIVDLHGIKLGVMVCFDMEFPEFARSLAQAGADLLITISANMEPFGPDHRVFSMARALENGLPHAYVNQIGEGEGFVFTGGTSLVSADGEDLVTASFSGQEVLSTVLSFPAKSVVRANYLEQLRSLHPRVLSPGK